MTGKSILVVEDHPDDEALLLRALGKSHPGLEVLVARDADRALDLLHGPAAGHPLARPLPSLVLIDLKLPRVDGHELLRRIRAHARTHLLPVVVLTSSTENEDVLRSYRLGANAYVRKPVDFVEFLVTMRALLAFWLQVNRVALVDGDGIDKQEPARPIAAIDSGDPRARPWNPA